MTGVVGGAPAVVGRVVRGGVARVELARRVPNRFHVRHHHHHGLTVVTTAAAVEFAAAALFRL